MIYHVREDLEDMDCVELEKIANERNLLDEFDDEDYYDEHILIGLIMDSQVDDRLAKEAAGENSENEE